MKPGTLRKVCGGWVGGWVGGGWWVVSKPILVISLKPKPRLIKNLIDLFCSPFTFQNDTKTPSETPHKDVHRWLPQVAG